jgi:hypothetical protein
MVGCLPADDPFSGQLFQAMTLPQGKTTLSHSPKISYIRPR